MNKETLNNLAKETRKELAENERIYSKQIKFAVEYIVMREIRERRLMVTNISEAHEIEAMVLENIRKNE